MAPVTGYIVVLYNIYSNYVDITPVVIIIIIYQSTNIVIIFS